MAQFILVLDLDQRVWFRISSTYFSVYEPSHVGKSGWLCTFLCVAIRVGPKLSRRYEINESQSSPFYQGTYSDLLMKVGWLDVLCAYFPE